MKHFSQSPSGVSLPTEAMVTVESALKALNESLRSTSKRKSSFVKRKLQISDFQFDEKDFPLRFVFHPNGAIYHVDDGSRHRNIKPWRQKNVFSMSFRTFSYFTSVKKSAMAINKV